jgi:predicted molibdopterin-dependent oxidoreductase YjgC
MTAFSIPPQTGPTMPAQAITVWFEGQPLTGTAGQTIAGLLLAAGVEAWRHGRPDSGGRGVFCGIGVCFGCLVAVNGLSDVRACQRRAQDGDIITGQS